MLSLHEAYAATRDGGVAVERPLGTRLIRLTGPQRVWFLQNTITADVDGVPDGNWVESCFLDGKGRVVAHFRVGFAGEEAWIDADPASGAGLAEWFMKYRFRTKVEIQPVDRPCVAIVGGPAADLAAEGAVRTADGSVVFGRTLAGVAIADVHGENPVPSLPAGPPELYEVLRVEAGIGEFGIDFGPTDLPQEAGLSRVLSVDKGCYVGQETIARIHFRGHVNRVLRPLAFAGVEVESAPGRKLIWEGRPVGSVTSAVSSPGAGDVGLGMVRVEPPERATLKVEGGGNATVGPIPEGTKVKAS